MTNKGKEMNNNENGFLIFGGRSNPGLFKKVAFYLNQSLGKIKLSQFSDGETEVEIVDNVRTKEVFVLQSTCYPVNDNLMELLLIIDALKRASAKRIVAVIPYFGYARQDKKVKPRVPISAKLVADLLASAGAHRIIAMDLHANQIQGFFNLPVDNLFAQPVFIKYIKENIPYNLVIVSPDAGGVERARSFAKILDAGLAIVDKRRTSPNKSKAMSLIGEVKGKRAILLDDMADTAGTLSDAADLVEQKGALEVHACCTHPVLSGPAIKKINESRIKTLITANTIPLGEKVNECPKLIPLSVAEVLGEAMKRSFTGDSVTSLFC